MKSLLFFLLAGYAARSEDNNYYVVEMLDDPPIYTKKPFKVYWNVPTMQCSSKKVPFENLYGKFGITQNDDDAFKGDKVTILYDPGLFPALFKNETSGKFRLRNGGVPQEGDLDKHLTAFKNDLNQSIPDANFSGIGIIDFESWRPVYRQNFGDLQPYKNVSYEIERNLHWWWQKSWLEAEAKRRFEEAARVFMQSTLMVAKQLRPNASWGFYGFPYCFNMASNNMVEACASNVPQENDQISWLWEESTALYPSVYSSAKLATSQLTSLIRGRLREASRCSRGRAQILPYFWFRYRDAGFMNKTDLNMALSTFYQSNATGFIIWGSSNDVNTVDKCNKLLNYVEKVLGPAIAKYTKPTNKLNDDTDQINITVSSLTNITTENPLINTVSNSNTMIDEDEISQPGNFTQNTNTHVEDELVNDNIRENTTTEGGDKAVLQNNSVLIDLLLSTVLNNESNTITTSPYSNDKDKKKDVLNNVDILSSSIEANNQTIFDASQSTYTIVTNNPLHKEINNTTSQIELNVLDNMNNTETRVETVTLEISNIATTEPDIYETTENEYDETFDDDDDEYFFNFDTIYNETSTGTTDKSFTNLSQTPSRTLATGNEFIDSETTTNDYTENKKTTVNKIEEDSIEQFSDSTTERFNINTENITNRSKEMTELSTNTILTTNVLFNDTVKCTTKEPSSNLDMTEELTTAEVTDNLEVSIEKSTKESELLKTTTAREDTTTSLGPTVTLTEQVSGSASRLKRSQYLYCFIFYIYSVSKCLCSIFGRCT